MRDAVPVKYFVDQLLVQTDGLKDLRAAIALQGRDAHLREGLQQAFVDGLDVVLDGLLSRHAFRQQAAAGQIFQGFDGQIRIDRAGAVADQQREMHHLARLAGFDDQRHLGARPFADQLIVDGGQRQQAGNRRVVVVHAAVGENQQRVAALDGQRGAAAKLVERRAPVRPRRPPPRKSVGSVVASKSPCETRRSFSRSRLVRIGCGSFSVWQFCGVSSRMLRSRADVADQRHHHLFANRIDRRIGDLREELLEIVEQRAAAGPRGTPAACPSPSSRSAPRPCAAMGVKNHLQVFFGVAEGPLPRQQTVRVSSAWTRGGLRQLIQSDLVPSATRHKAAVQPTAS